MKRSVSPSMFKPRSYAPKFEHKSKFMSFTLLFILAGFQSCSSKIAPEAPKEFHDVASVDSSRSLSSDFGRLIVPIEKSPKNISLILQNKANGQSYRLPLANAEPINYFDIEPGVYTWAAIEGPEELLTGVAGLVPFQFIVQPGRHSISSELSIDIKDNNNCLSGKCIDIDLRIPTPESKVPALIRKKTDQQKFINAYTGIPFGGKSSNFYDLKTKGVECNLLLTDLRNRTGRNKKGDNEARKIAKLLEPWVNSNLENAVKALSECVAAEVNKNPLAYLGEFWMQVGILNGMTVTNFDYLNSTALVSEDLGPCFLQPWLAASRLAPLEPMTFSCTNGEKFWE